MINQIQYSSIFKATTVHDIEKSVVTVRLQIPNFIQAFLYVFR